MLLLSLGPTGEGEEAEGEVLPRLESDELTDFLDKERARRD
jgi:hypothetical protein